MRSFVAVILVAISGSASAADYAADWALAHARCRPVPLNRVRAEGFLGRRIRTNERSLLEGLRSPIPRRFEARAAGIEPGPETNRLAADSDLFKWMEGAAYMVALTGNEDLKHELERIAELVVACQKPDGYINTQVPPNQRFDPRINHDLYSAGHFFEAAVAHARAMGTRRLLDAARRWADYLIAEYRAGNPYFATVARREHSEYELGLLRLHRATGDPHYLEFSTTLTRLIPPGRHLLDGRHAVRVNYLLTAHADLFLQTGEREWRAELAPIWDEIVTTRSFVAGGVGVHEEAYQREPYYLPQVTDHPRRDIAETCASVSLMMLAWRLHSITGESRYFDQIEKILYNHFLGALSLDHLATFYYNPLRMVGERKGKTDHDGPLTARTRLPAIHSTACCMTNAWRFLGALTEYIFSFDDEGLWVNLYTSGSVQHGEVALSMVTRYPHDGRVAVRIGGVRPARYKLRLRIPGWCDSAVLKISGDSRRTVQGGQYFTVERLWKPGEIVELNFPMAPRMFVPDPHDRENAGQAALTRGPLVYCLEQQDATFPIHNARWGLSASEAPRRVKLVRRDDLLGGINLLVAPGFVGGKRTPLHLIPFYARANRVGENQWLTFLPQRGFTTVDGIRRRETSLQR